MITHIEARIPLCKTYNPKSGKFNTYPTRVAKVKTRNHDVKTPKELSELLNKLANLGYAVTLGQPDKDLEWERRRKRYDRGQPTNLFCLDLDKIPLSLHDCIQLLPEPFKNTQAVWQPSASMHLPVTSSSSASASASATTSGHLFYFLDQSTSYSTIQSYVKHLNLSIFKEYITLSATKLFLSWPLDVAIYQPSRILYIAPPSDLPESLHSDPSNSSNSSNSSNPSNPSNSSNLSDPSRTKIQVINQTNPTTNVDNPTTIALSYLTSNTPVEALIVERTQDLIQSLRNDEGFKKLPSGSKSFKINNDILMNPEPGKCHVVDDSDPYFIRLNINDGDSEAYYINKYNAEFISNFKGEPKIPLKKFDPDFYDLLQDKYTNTPENLKKQLIENPNDYSILGPLFQADEDNNIVLPYVNPVRDTMNVCVYNTVTHKIKTYTFSNEKRLWALLHHHRREPLDPSLFPAWEERFDPTVAGSQTFDPFHQTISLFRPSDLFRHLLCKFPPDSPRLSQSQDSSPSSSPSPNPSPSPQDSSTPSLLPFHDFAHTLYHYAPLHYQILHNAVGGQWADVPPRVLTDPTHPDFDINYLHAALPDLDPHTDSPEEYVRHARFLWIETNYLINWMAYIFQTRHKTRTAWLLQGTSKTGKSSIVELIFTPIFNVEHSVLKEYKQLESQFTAWMETLVIIGLDECKAESKDQMAIQQSMKHQITQELLSLQEKHVSQKKGQNTPSYSNFIFCTNKSDAIKMETGESTRFNVGTFQNRSLMVQKPFTDPDFHLPTELEKERYKFLEFMLQLPVDPYKATKALDNDAKITLTDAAMSHASKFALAILQGNLTKILHMLPSREDVEAIPDHHWRAQVMGYHRQIQQILLDWLLNSTAPAKPNWIQVVDAYKLYIMSDYENSRPKTKREFLQHMGHLNLPKHTNRQTPRGRRRNSALVFYDKFQFKQPTPLATMEIIEFCGDVISESEHSLITERFLDV